MALATVPGMPFASAPLMNFWLVLEQYVVFLLGDRLAQLVGFRGGIPGQVHRRAHDLFLVDRDAVGFFEDGLHRSVEVLDRFLAVHAPDVARDELQRAGAVERHHGDDVVQVVRAHLHQEAGHPCAFQLEDAGRVPRAEKFERLGVIDRDVVQVQLHAVALLDQVAGALHDRQGGQAEEVHLEQPERLDDRHLELGHRLDRRVFVNVAGRAVQRDVVDHRLVGDDHPGGMGAGVAHHAFHAARRCRSGPSGSRSRRRAL